MHSPYKHIHLLALNVSFVKQTNVIDAANLPSNTSPVSAEIQITILNFGN